MTGLLAERGSYVDGAWIEGDTVFSVEDPATEQTVAELTATPLREIERALLAARRAFDAGLWSERSADERASVVRELLDHLTALHDPLLATIVAESGQPTWYADMAQLGLGLAAARQTVDLYLGLQDEEVNRMPVDGLVTRSVALSLRRYEPVGVVTAITPYNGALIMALQKLVPALLAGNSVVLRPSPLTPLSSLALALAAEAAGLPAGVLSVVVEQGAEGAELMTTHPAVDMISFTGSTTVGRRILAQAAPTVKRVALELGGKSAQIYLPDAVDAAAAGAARVVAGSAGQACIAATRMLVPQESKAAVLEAVAATYGALTVGPPTEAGTLLGPLIDAGARARVERYLRLAEEHGAKVVCGGGRPGHLGQGHYVEATVLDVPDNANPAAQEEIFGPVLSVLGYDDVDDAVHTANDSPYGLAGQVYGADVAAALAVARRLRVGAVSVNTSLFSAYAPSGGYKQSGLGRERGVEGVRAFQETKHLAVGELAR